MKKHIYDESNGLKLHTAWRLLSAGLAVNEDEPTYGKIWNTAEAIPEKSIDRHDTSIY